MIGATKLSCAAGSLNEAGAFIGVSRSSPLLHSGRVCLWLVIAIVAGLNCSGGLKETGSETVQGELQSGGFGLYPSNRVIYSDSYVPGAALDTDNDGIVDTIVESFGEGVQITSLRNDKPWMIERHDSQNRRVYVWLDED